MLVLVPTACNKSELTDIIKCWIIFNHVSYGEKAMEQHISFKRKNTIQSDKANDKWENLVDP